MRFEDLCENVPINDLPRLDKPGLDEALLTPDQLYWRTNGYLIKRAFIPDVLIDAYCARWEKDNAGKGGVGYQSDIPYMRVNEIKDLCLYAPLMELLKELIGHEMGMHLNLSNWVSTERNWHQDDYLNPPFINAHYAAVWMALGEIVPDAGPFEYVPGSHRWPVIRREKMLGALNYTGRDWPKHSEKILNKLFEEKIEEKGATVKKFTAKKGDILIWHGWLAHRGSVPKDRSLKRKALITHYSSLDHRRDMTRRVLHKTGLSEGHYFAL